MFSNCSYISAESEYTFPNGSTLSLAIAREPGRIGWVTGASGFDDGILAGNIQMDSGGRNGCMSNMDKWPKNRKDENDDVTVYKWYHSDFKNLVYFFVHRLFDKFVHGDE